MSALPPEPRRTIRFGPISEAQALTAITAHLRATYTPSRDGITRGLPAWAFRDGDRREPVWRNGEPDFGIDAGGSND